MPVIINYLSQTPNDQNQTSAEQIITLRVSLCDALSNIGVNVFERLPQGTQMQLCALLSSISSCNEDGTIIAAAATRALAVYVLFPALHDNLVLVENVAELTLRLSNDSNLLVRIKAFWSMGNVSDALLNNSQQERISSDLLRRLIEAATAGCSDHNKVRCNAVRTLGSLLSLLHAEQLQNNKEVFNKAINKLIESIKGAAGGNAKVKWNACYAIGNVLSNSALFEIAEQPWQASLYNSLCHVIVNHSNFKVRIKATAAISQIKQRSHYAQYFEQFWISILAALEQSHHLDNFYEYNHRDELQEQLCLAIVHFINCASLDDFLMMQRHLKEKLEMTQNTWKRVSNRMIPEKAAPLLAVSTVLRARLESNINCSNECKKALAFIAQALAAE